MHLLRVGGVLRQQFPIALVASIWLSLEFWSLGPWSWIYGYGGSLETIPTYLGLKHTGSTFALWAPFVAGGVDRLSFWGNADPFNLEPLLFTWLPVWAANGLHAFLQRFVAILFTGVVLQEQLGFSRRAASAGGLLHGCFSYYTVGAMFTSPAVPFILWALHRVQAARFFVPAAIALGAGASVLTTFAHGVPYLAVFVLAWFVVVLGCRQSRQVAVCLIALGTLAAFELHQVLALVLNAPFSMRSAYAAESLGMSLAGLFYFQPEFDFFNQDPSLKAIVILGPPLIIAAGLIAALAGRGSERDRSLFWRLALVYALLSSKFLLVGGQRLISMLVPWVDGVYMGRLYMVPYPFLVAALIVTVARLALHGPVARLLRPIALVASASTVAFMLVWPKMALWRPLMIDSWGQQHYEVTALEELKATDRSLFRVASILDLQPAYSYAHGLEAADGWANLYPRVYREFWLRVLTPLFERLPRNRDIFAPEIGRPQDNYIFLGSGLLTPGIGVLPDEDAGRALTEGFDVAQRFNVNLLSLLNVKYLLSEYPLKGPHLRLVHAPDPMPRGLVSRDYATGLVNSPRPAPVADEPWSTRIGRLQRERRQALDRRRAGKDVFIYRNDAALPRFRFVRRARVLDDAQRVLDAVSVASIAHLEETAFVEAADGGPLQHIVEPAVGTVVVERYGSDEIVLLVDCSTPGLLVAAMTWNPFWTAQFKSRPLPIVRVNHAQLAIATEPGRGRLVLRYEPPYVSLLGTPGS